MADPYRILVTGWRHWPAELAEFVEMRISDALGGRPSYNRPSVIVHGACPVGDGGVDSIAARYAATRHMVTVEAHPAEVVGGRLLGPQRNQRMVDLGADVCLGFPGPNSRGTVDCLRRAWDAGIYCEVYSLAYARRRLARRESSG